MDNIQRAKEIKFQSIDELTRKRHRYLVDGDICYHWRTYISKGDFKVYDTNNVIENFKKELPAQGAPLHYKNKAIKQLAKEFFEIISKNEQRIEYIKNSTFIPIPPSAKKGEKKYDDRLLRLLYTVSDLLKLPLDIREVISNRVSVPPSHKSEKRLSQDDLLSNYMINEDLCNKLHKRIIIFDDVITAGSHYKAMQKTLLQHPNFSSKKIIGFFIARAVNPNYNTTL